MLFLLARPKRIGKASCRVWPFIQVSFQNIAFAPLPRVTRRAHRFVELWNKVQLVHLTEEPDSITWTRTPDGAYSASSAYAAYFTLHTLKPLLAAVWEVKTEGKIKFFLWLIMQNRLWTGDRLQARGWQHQDRCALCDQDPESANHIFLTC
jgi:hypothetical protein